jgi:hypothetical protein
MPDTFVMVDKGQSTKKGKLLTVGYLVTNWDHCPKPSSLRCAITHHIMAATTPKQFQFKLVLLGLSYFVYILISDQSL